MINDRGRTITMPSAESSSKAREETWLWLYCQNLGANFPVESFRGLSMMLDIKNFADNINGVSGGVAWLRMSQMDLWLLPAEHLNWITDEKRQHKWLLSYIWRQLTFAINPIPPALLGRSLVIATLDIWKSKIADKSMFVEQMKRDWNQHKQNDRIFIWFQKDDEISRCELAWNWLMENKFFWLPGILPISSYEELLIFFDNLFINGTPVSDAEKTLIVDKIKKRGAQQKYREKNKDKGKIQCNVELSKKTISSLNKLTAKYGISKAQLIETLIQYEMDKNLYLPDKARLIAAWQE